MKKDAKDVGKTLLYDGYRSFMYPPPLTSIVSSRTISNVEFVL